MSYIPEQVDVVASTNGPQGGDAGHGGNTQITFCENGSGSNMVNIKLRDGREYQFDPGEWESVTVTAFGDWEGCGLHLGIRAAAELLDVRWAGYTAEFEAGADEGAPEDLP